MLYAFPEFRHRHFLEVLGLVFKVNSKESSKIINDWNKFESTKYKFYDHTLCSDSFSWIVLTSGIVQKWSYSWWNIETVIKLKRGVLYENAEFDSHQLPESRVNNEIESQVHHWFERACYIMSQGGKYRTGLRQTSVLLLLLTPLIGPHLAWRQVSSGLCRWAINKELLFHYLKFAYYFKVWMWHVTSLYLPCSHVYSCSHFDPSFVLKIFFSVLKLERAHFRGVLP